MQFAAKLDANPGDSRYSS